MANQIRKFSTFGAALFAGASMLATAAWAAQSSYISLPMDEVRMVTFNEPVATIYVGNPLIADITVVDAKKIFVLGKNFGSTNLIALDREGNQKFEKHITVYGRQGSSVTVQRGKSQVTLACVGSRCEAAPLPGDAKDQFDMISSQQDARQSAQVKAASLGQ